MVVNKGTRSSQKDQSSRAAQQGGGAHHPDTSGDSTTTRSATADDPAMKAAARAYALSGVKQKPSKKKMGATTTVAALPLRSPSTRSRAAAPYSERASLPLEEEEDTAAETNAMETDEATIEPLPLSAPTLDVEDAELTAAAMVQLQDDGDLDDYGLFVKSLGLDDDWKLRDDDDEEEFSLDAMDDGDTDEDDASPNTAQHLVNKKTSTKDSAESSSTLAFDLLEWDPNFYQELEAELGGLEEEDMEAAVATLLDHTKKKPEMEETPASLSPTGQAESSKTAPQATAETGDNPEAPTNTPLRDVARASRAIVTTDQFDEFRKLMSQHYQLLTQQAVLSVRAAHATKLHRARTASVSACERESFVSGGETADDLVEIVDGAVGMLQDLDQNRKDAIRNSIQLETAPARRSLLSEMEASEEDSMLSATGERRLTRAQFSKTLEKHPNGRRRTVFDVQGLGKLKETFVMLDKSAEDDIKGEKNILHLDSNAVACRQVLDAAGAVYDKDSVPGGRDLSVNFCEAKEYLGSSFRSPCTEEQEMILRRNRNLFTSGEDNLILRGVNLYGEKQWTLISDRYMPDRSINIIAQRYSKLCVMLYKAHGVPVDDDGELLEVPKLESIDDLDEEKVGKLKKVTPPAILNVHRWSMEEDVTLLKAVPLMGNMWAELGVRFMPHRDRGHLRKRYQVLERRVKAAITRANKHDSACTLAAKYGKAAKNQSPVKAVVAVPADHRFQAPAPVRPVTGANSVGLAASILARAKLAPSSRPPPPHQPPPLPPLPPHRSPPLRSPHLATGQMFPFGAVPRAHAPPQARATGAPSQGRMHPLLVSLASASPGSRPHILPHQSFDRSNDGASRNAFERLMKDGDGDGDGDWSQMSRMQKMLENDTESMVANAIVSQLAKSPAKAARRHVDTGTFGTDDDVSGFSMLDSYRPSPTKRHGGEGVSLLAGVLERTRDSLGSSSSRQSASGAPLIGDLTTRTTATSKLLPKPSAAPTAMQAPSTPNGPIVFSTSGTPIGLSPGFHLAGAPNSGLKPTMSPAMSIDSFPTRAAAEIANHQNSMEGNSMLGYNLTGLFESQTPEASKSSQPRPSPVKTPTSRPLFGDDATLMENDLEAISALNQLSHSPVLKRPASSQDRPREQNESSSNTGGESKSFFAKAIGGVIDKESRKKRLKF